MSHQSLMRVVCGSLSLVAMGAWAGATAIPADWNQSTWTSGSYFENFNSATVPTWAGDSTLVTGRAAASTATRFWESETGYEIGNQLCFATDGITNEFTGASSSVLDPLYVDMMCKFTPMTDTPEDETSAYVLRTYVTSSSNLVVQTPLACSTNSAQTVSPDNYYRMTIKLAGTNYQINLNDSTLVSIKGTASSFSKLIFAGSGYLDDLYVSHGDPTRSAGYVPGADPVAVGDTGASTAELAAMNNYFATVGITNGVTSATTGVTPAAVEKYFLTGTTPVVKAGALVDPAIDLGISDFSYDPTGTVTVKVYLKVNGETLKSGTINGRIQLYGATTYDNAKAGTWVALDAKTPIMTEFTSGYTAEYTFTGLGTTYKFFKPVIVTQ